ncbi:DUF1601 domain-containing protein [Endozoicomonas acroporae]|uniref:DUF1601 domain-containing protein n=1 Tax=Endozoicomonas acroporae TaxID=1701104 RepID=UPI003D7BCD99
MMDKGGAGISWTRTTRGNDYNQPDDRTGASGSGRYRYGTVRQSNTPLPYIPERHEFYRASDACSANHPPRHSIKPVQDFNAFITQAKMGDLMRIFTHYGDRCNGKKHSQFACSIKQYTSRSKRPLNHSEQRQLLPLLHNFKVTPGWTWRSLTTTLHSFTSAGVLTPHKYMNEGDRKIQATLLSTLLDGLILKCNQKNEASDIDVRGIANLLWAVAKLLDNGLELEKIPKLKEAVATLLPHVKTKAESKEGKDHFDTQSIANLLWAMAKLVDNGLEKTLKFKEAVAALLPHVKTKAESKEEKDHFIPQHIANLLWALAKLVDKGLKLERTAKLKEAVAALLPCVKNGAEAKEVKDGFKPQEVANQLWAMAKLLDNGLELEKTPKLREAVAALLANVKTKAKSKEERDHFNPLEVANLLWAMAKLMDSRLDLGKTPKLKETVVVLLSCVKIRAESKQEKVLFTPQYVTSLLWSVAKLVDNGLELEKAPKLKEAVDMLLPHVKTMAESKEERDHFKPQEVSNLLWAIAKLVDNSLELEKTPKLKEALAALLPHVKTKAESKEEKDHFIPQHIANLLWALAKLVDNGLEKTAILKEAVVALLAWVKIKAESKEEKDLFIPQHIANLLWALAKLVDNGLEPEKTEKLKEVVAALLPHVKTNAESKEERDHFNIQGTANLLWALAKLGDNGLEKTAKLKEALAALLSHVKTKAESKEEKDHFIPQHIANLLWALAKLVDNGLEPEKTEKLKEVVAALLPHVKTKAESKDERDHFKPQGVANLLWALAKLGDNGLEKAAKLKEIMTVLLYNVKNKVESTKEKDHFKPQEVTNLLWVLAKLGEAIELNLVKSTFDSLVERISESSQFYQQGVLMSLWGVMVFCARFYLCNYTNNKSLLEKHVGELFSCLENTLQLNTEDESIIAMAASWLGRACPVVPHYRTVISQSQSSLRDQLQSSLPSLKIEEEKSLNSLPPVDLLLPDYNVVIDVQGPSHYVCGDFKTRNGSTLLKVALLKKLGFEVIEIPVNRLWKQDSMTRVIEQIKTKLAVLPEAHGPVSPDSSEWAADEAYFTADEGGQFSDDCYFTAEEYLEEQINKPKKRKRKRKKPGKLLPGDAVE